VSIAIGTGLRPGLASAQDLVTVIAADAGGTVGGGGPVAPGDRIAVTAAPAAGSYFVGWTENGVLVSTAARYAFTVPSPPRPASRTLVAVFSAAAEPVIRVSVAGAGTASGGGAIPLGATATLTASASSGATFVGWSEDGAVVGTAPTYAFTVRGPRRLCANFTAGTAAPLSVALNGGERFVPLGRWAALAAAPTVSGGVPPYRYAWTLVNASISQAELPALAGIAYGADAAVEAVGSDVAADPARYDGPRNPIAVTVTDSTGATASAACDHVFMTAPATGPIVARPGWRMYSHLGASDQAQRFGVYVPPCYDPARPLPLLVDINKRGIPSITEFMPYADTMGFAIIGFPDLGLDDAPDRDGTMMDAIDRLIAGGGYHGQVAIDRAAVLAVGLSGGVPFGVWAPAGQHPEVFTALAAQSGNYFGDQVAAAFATRPIYVQWAEDDRATILRQTPAALDYFRNRLHCTQLTTSLVSAGHGGHTSHPDRVIAWWTPFLPRRAAAIHGQPRSRTVIAGQDASFSVEAAGVPAPSYQWQTSSDGATWSAAPGGSAAATYSWRSASSAESGLRFRCVVANPGGSAVSSAATLTVLAGTRLP
jgi:hypothetical protein